MIDYLKRVGRLFMANDQDVTELYYSGTHQIVLSGDCVNPAIDVIESLSDINFLVYDDELYCYVVAPELTAQSFFEQVVKPVEAAVAHIFEDDGSYSIRPKIPATPALPSGPEDALAASLNGNVYYLVDIRLGRGYGNRWSEVTIWMSKNGREICYNVQRYLNKVSGPKKDGENQLFTGIGAQWRAICFAYGITPDEAKTKEAAQRAKKFVYAVVGEMMDRLWSNQTQPRFMDQWRSLAVAEATA